MATAIKCDRCGNLEEGIGVGIGVGLKDMKDIITSNLCDTCYKSFVEWWDSGKDGIEERQGCPSC